MKLSRCISALIAVGVVSLGQTPAAAQTNADLLKELQTLKNRVQELERKLAAPTVPPASKPTPLPAGDEKSKIDEVVKWSDLVAGKARFKLYGFLRGDFIYDDSRPGGNLANSSLVPVFIGSENGLGGPVNLAPGRNQANFLMHPRLTRLGLDVSSPEIELLGGAKPGGKLEIDFYNFVAGSAESREFLRMRHAYAQLKWDDAMFLAGQTSDLISQYWPVVNPDFGGMWGAGNLGDRRPQFRLDWTPQAGPGNLLLQGMAGLTGAVDARDLDGNGIRDGEASGMPTLQGRVGYRFPVWEKQMFELAAWVHHARERVHLGLPAGGRQNFTSEAYGVDLSLPLYKDILSLKAEGWTGNNLDDVRGGILQGINIATGQEIRAQGGWIELTLKPRKWYSLHTGYLVDNPQNRDLPAQAPDLNSVWYLAGRLYFDNIELGLDYLNWTTEFKDPAGRGKGQDNRFQGFISYKF